MKRFLSFIALFCFMAASAFALQETPIASAPRVATTTYSADMFLRKEDRGAITINSNTTVLPNASTITLTLQGKTPQGGYYDVLSSAATALSTSTFVVIKVGPGYPVTTNLSGNEYLPPVFRIKSVLVGTATYSIGAGRH